MIDKIRKNYENYMEALVFAAIVCLSISTYGGYYMILTTIGEHSRLLDKIGFALLFTKVLGTRYNKREFLIVVTAGILALVNYRISNNAGMLYNALLIASLKNVDLKKMFWVSLYATLFSIALMAFLSVSGIAGEVALIQNYGRGGVETRYCFGYSHPNQWAHAVFMALLLYVLADWERLNWWKLLVAGAVNFGAYLLSVSRTGFLAGCVLLLLAVLYRYGAKFMNLVFVQLLAFAGITSLWILPWTAMTDTKIGNLLVDLFNKILTNRLTLARHFYEAYGTSLFGKMVDVVYFVNDKKQIVLDLGYIRFLLENGVVIYGLTLAAVCLLTVHAFKKQRGWMITGIVCVCVYALNESMPLSKIPATLFLFFLQDMIFQKPQEKS